MQAARPACDLIVVGGGILGVFHAYEACRRGLRVKLFERNLYGNDASVRNFGCVIPSGLSGVWRERGQASLDVYRTLEKAGVAGVTYRENGSVYLATDDDEMTLLEEYHTILKQGAKPHPSELITAARCAEHCPGVSQRVVGGLFLPTEGSVESRDLLQRVIVHMQCEYSHFEYHPSTSVIACDTSGTDSATILTNRGTHREHTARKALLCTGHATALYPEVFEASPLTVVKLEMFDTVPQPPQYRLPSSVLSGLSIRRYENFRECPSYEAVKQREVSDPDVKERGVHIIFKQNVDGSVVVGDSHEYAAIADAHRLTFDIDNTTQALILKHAKDLLSLPTYSVRNRWYGVYSQMADGNCFDVSPSKNVRILTGIGGRGMTASAGLAPCTIDELFGTV